MITFDNASVIADIGCGTGVLLPELNARAPKGSRVFCVDFAVHMIHQAKNGAHSFPDSSFIAADGEYTPFHSNFFDLIICFATFAHFADKYRALKEFYRILNPGGDAYIIHLLSSAEIAAVHGSAGKPIEQDTLPDRGEMLRIMQHTGFGNPTVIDEPGLYFASARKMRAVS